MEGQLSQNPLAELIREIIDSELSGSLRMSREAAKVIVYFDAGQPVLAASNLRPYRLREVLKRNGFAPEFLDIYPASSTDEELAAALTQAGRITTEELEKARLKQTGDVLRAALLWIDGTWQFDQRVRVPKDLRVKLNPNRLLLESARHLPFEFVKTRLADKNSAYSVGTKEDSINLLPAESSVLSRASAAGKVFTASDLAPNGLTEEDYLRGLYALSLAGILERLDWSLAFSIKRPQKHVAEGKKAAAPVDQATDVNAFLSRLKAAKDYYEVLEVAKIATTEQIKDAYHMLARQYHPDRFHQDDPELRNQIGTACARIAQAYEVLSNTSQREAYDKKREAKSSGTASQPTAASQQDPKRAPTTKTEGRAEISFRSGLEALEQNKLDEACRLLGEAATLQPREARYRAQYGRALTHRADSRRIAESELQAALALEPNNAAFRIMLAELYQRVGLRRRAETEAARALASDPGNKAARTLLASLKNK
jgi:curved DNA-binding protein CbpA